jgi:hypothetical protein
VDWFLSLAYACRRFFHPSEIENMLETILPRLDGTNMSVSTQCTALSRMSCILISHCSPC